MFSQEKKKKRLYIQCLYRADRDYNSDLCASGGVTSRIKYLSVTVKAASYTTALAPQLSGGCHSRQEPTDILGSELTATGVRRSATSVASSSRKDVQNAAVPLT